MLRNITVVENIMKGKTSTGVGNTFFVNDYGNIVMSISSSGSASFTIKFKGSISQNPVDFSAAKSPTNQWEYIQVKDYQNDASINGSTGITFSGDDVRIVEFNTNGLSWVTADITSYSAGEITVDARAYSVA